jgi:CheY-like chemotaxis protein/putative methionine-R-sulfoxide reductase with GAF domain
VPKVLFVNDQSGNALSAAHFDNATDVVETTSACGAIELLAEQQFDAMVICNTKEQGLSLQQYLHNEAVLDCVPLGVALLDASQRILKMNQRLSGWLNKPNLGGLSFLECLGEFSVYGQDPNPLKLVVTKRTACRATIQIGEQYFSLYVTPILNEKGECYQMVATLRDATQEIIQKQKFEALHRAGAELTDLRPEEIYQMGFSERIELLIDNIHHYTKDLLNFDVVEIRVLNAESLELKPLLSVGMDSGITQRALFAKKEGNGVTGFVAATGKSYLCEDTTEDELYLDGLVGAKSALTVPLKYHDEIVGTFNVESPVVNRFSAYDLMFLESFANYIAIALNTLELLNAQRTNATLESIGAIREVVGTPVDEILNHTVQLMASIDSLDPKSAERLEVIAADSVPGCVKTEVTTSLKNKSVLVIDSDADVRESAHKLLERQGCVVETAHTGDEALMMVRAAHRGQRYHAILADIRLPDIKGYDLLVKLKEFYPSPPLVLMTGFGYDPAHTLPKAREAGLRANAILYKPFKLEQVLEILDATVGGA